MGGPIPFVENRMMTKADMERLIADDEGERAAKRAVRAPECCGGEPESWQLEGMNNE